MKQFRTLILLSALAATACSDAQPTLKELAPTPPMGWNSWDIFGTTVTEKQTKEQFSQDSSQKA